MIRVEQGTSSAPVTICSRLRGRGACRQANQRNGDMFEDPKFIASVGHEGRNWTGLPGSGRRFNSRERAGFAFVPRKSWSGTE